MLLVQKKTCCEKLPACLLVTWHYPMQDQIKLVITGISLCFGSDLRWKLKKPGESGEKLVLAATNQRGS